MSFGINNFQLDKAIEDCLIVSFDYNLSNDVATMIVARKDCDNVKILNSFIGDEAIDLYYKLVRR